MKLTKMSEDNGLETYLIKGESLDSLIVECLKRIRQQSKEFYRKELRKDLEDKGESHIDCHAGMGNFYKVQLL